jgi:hypothetical protein
MFLIGARTRDHYLNVNIEWIRGTAFGVSAKRLIGKEVRLKDCV